MKKRIIKFVICSCEIAIMISLFIWCVYDATQATQGIQHIKSMPEVYGENPNLSYNYKLLTECICKALLCFLGLCGFVGALICLLLNSFSISENLAAWKEHRVTKKAERKQAKLEKAQNKVEQLQAELKKDE